MRAWLVRKIRLSFWSPTEVCNSISICSEVLGNLGLNYDPPRGEALTNDEGIRTVYCLLRIVRDISTRNADYVAHRSLLALLSQVGPGTAKGVADACVANNQNFHELFYLPAVPQWLNTRGFNAVTRVHNIIQAMNTWSFGGHTAKPVARNHGHFGRGICRCGHSQV